MCYPNDSTSPEAPGVTAHAPVPVILTLETASGARSSAAYAAPAEPPRAGVVILPDARGLHPFYISFAAQLASVGLAAIAIDYYGRTLGILERDRPDDFAWQEHLPNVDTQDIDDDAAAAIDFLRERHGAELPLFTIGFCFGGSQAWRQAASPLPLAGCIGFYGRPARVGDAADHVRRPVLMIIAGADEQTPLEEQLALADRMRWTGADVTLRTFEGAPHSFFDGSLPEWEASCQEAWALVLTFIEGALKTPD